MYYKSPIEQKALEAYYHDSNFKSNHGSHLMEGGEIEMKSITNKKDFHLEGGGRKSEKRRPSFI